MSKIEENKHSSKHKLKRPPMNLSKFSSARVIQKQLVYVIGLSSNLANKEVTHKTNPRL
jgi:hypothetical protein